MLRRPGDWLVARRGEGRSSTAFDPSKNFDFEVWNNPAGRGSSKSKLFEGSAVP
jgi:hypothetical protein